MTPQYLDRIRAFFDNKVQALVRKTRVKQLRRVLFVKGVGGVSSQYFKQKALKTSIFQGFLIKTNIRFLT
jgi:hypothetical protein